MFETWDNARTPRRLGATFNLGATDRKEALRAAKAAAKAAGLPFDQEAWVNQYDNQGGGQVIMPVTTSPTTLPAPPTQGTATGGGLQAPTTQPAGGSVMDGIGNFFSSVNPTYLLIGGSIAVFMLLKKR